MGLPSFYAEYHSALCVYVSGYYQFFSFICFSAHGMIAYFGSCQADPLSMKVCLFEM